MKLDWERLSGLRVTVMGLGLHGGGVASAAFFAEHGAEVTVTDLRGHDELAASIEQLAPYRIRYVLGHHDTKDFAAADIVIKNPAVSLDSPYLKASTQLESDISVFLRLIENPLIAVTGTKGKSTTSSALHHVLKTVDTAAKLGGNITVSPLRFADELRNGNPNTPVVLELSSWQLADLRGRGLLRPRVAVVTNILPDHMNRYRGMDDYVADKMVIVENLSDRDFAVCNYDDPFAERFAQGSPAHARYFSTRKLPDELEGGWLAGDERIAFLRSEGKSRELLRPPLIVPGEHNRLNLLAAGVALSCLGIPDQKIASGLSSFPGIRHRLELIGVVMERRFYNDSAATIPEASAAALESFSEPVVLIAGGTDKELDFAPFRRISRRPRCVVLLKGSASSKLQLLLEEQGIPSAGPFDSLGSALDRAMEESKAGDVVLLSPGCASFEMFKNEFDRGDSFVRAVKALEGKAGS